MKPVARDEWNVIESLLPPGWRDAAREQGAFRRARYIADPGTLLRLLLFHAVNDSGLRETVAQAEVSGIASMSQVALLKRLRTASKWLAWLCAKMCQSLRETPRLPDALFMAPSSQEWKPPPIPGRFTIALVSHAMKQTTFASLSYSTKKRQTR
ncbi:hypothetical protein EO087_01390 [Dyella sp. M7H15-1]|uniref:hypothetical protein n=1 Tax=Dyella sp. M7H15-1 TaxID=2501295 RepID=UPI001004E0CE|nr:hypothetical protein [Dyella sp. M7H15-1]QAU22801.1 hypothetical protein EO087_01390 [Dyella sp. M7H15-1]